MNDENFYSIAKLFFSGVLASDSVLKDTFEIESLLIILRDLDEKESWFKQLKKKRAEAIDQQIDLIDQNREKLRNIILNSMKELTPDKKSLEFPGVGKVQRKSSKPKWIVNESEEVISFLEEAGKDKGCVVLEKKIIKKELDKVLEQYYETSMEVPGVTREEGKDALAITITPDEKKNNLSIDNLDGLDSV